MLRNLDVSGDRLPLLDDPVSWHVHYRLTSFGQGSGIDVSVRVDKEVFCITERYLRRNSFHININTIDKMPGIDYYSCPGSGRRRDIVGTAGRYELPFVMISVNRDADKPPDVTHWCRHAWGEAGSVRVAVGRNLALRIVPMTAGDSNKTQMVAVVLSDVTAGGDRSRTSGESYNNRSIATTGHEERKNVTCFLKARDEIHRHVFSGTPSGLVCEEKRAETQTTEEPQTRPTNKVRLDQTSPDTTPALIVPGQRGKERSLAVGVGTFTTLTVVLVIAACIIRKRCGSREHQAAQAPPGPPLAVVSTSRWMISGANSQTIGVSRNTTSRETGAGPVGQDATNQGTGAGTVGQDSQSSTGDDPQYSRIPDEHFTYYNTRPWVQHPYWEIPDHNDYNNARPEVQHPYWRIPDDGDYYNAQQHPYCEIPDRYFDYENTRPHSLPPIYSPHDDDDDDPVRFYATEAEVVLPSSARQGGRHPDYGTAPPTTVIQNRYRTARQRMAHVRQYGTLPRTRSDPQIPVHQRLAHVRLYGVSAAGRYRARDLTLIGKYGRDQLGRTLYHNPAVHSSMAAAQRANVNVETCEQGSKGRAHRSETVSTDMSNTRIKHSTDKAVHRRQSI
ncbi:hypothetical protein Bbelb_280920 [Branchiostoma belcheri]|nr:hypothetical protein Bbelb_280920 [Branchiostoma belcheri]